MCQDMSSIALCEVVLFIIGCIVCVTGIIGNTLSFAVLHKSTGGLVGTYLLEALVGTYLLEALAVTDNVFLAISACIHTNFIISNYYYPSVQYYTAFQAYIWPLGHITQMWTVWMIVIVAGNRYIAVCRPMDVPRLCSKCNVQLEILIMAGAVCVYNIPHFFEFRLGVHNVTVVDHNNMTQWPEESANVGIASIYLYNILYKMYVMVCLLSYCRWPLLYTSMSILCVS